MTEQLQMSKSSKGQPSNFNQEQETHWLEIDLLQDKNLQFLGQTI